VLGAVAYILYSLAANRDDHNNPSSFRKFLFTFSFLEGEYRKKLSKRKGVVVVISLFI